MNPLSRISAALASADKQTATQVQSVSPKEVTLVGSETPVPPVASATTVTVSEVAVTLAGTALQTEVGPSTETAHEPEQSGDAELVQPEGAPVDKKVIAFNEEAWALYNNPSGLTDRVRYGFYLPLDSARQVAEALGRPLDLAELRMLVAEDGEHTCVACEKTFKAFTWVHVSGQFLDTVRNTKSVLTAVKDAISLGHFFIGSRRADHPGGFCGSPFRFERDNVFIPKWTCLSQAREQNTDEKGRPRFGLSSAGAQALIDDHKRRDEERRQASAKIRNRVGDFFGKGRDNRSQPRDNRDDRQENGGGNNPRRWQR